MTRTYPFSFSFFNEIFAYNIYNKSVHGSSLYPTKTQPNIIEWGRFRLATNPNEFTDQPGRVILVFECESVGFGFSDLPGFGQV